MVPRRGVVLHRSGSRFAAAALLALGLGAAARASSPADVVWFAAGHADQLSSVGVSPDGQYYLSGGHFTDSTVKVFRAADGKLVRTFPGGIGNFVFGGFQPVRMRSDNRYVLSVGEASNVVLWDMTNGAMVFNTTQLTRDVVFSADEASIIGAVESTGIVWWRISDGQAYRTWPATGRTLGVAASRDGTFVVSSHGDGTVRIWDVASGSVVHTLTGHTTDVYTVALSTDDQWIATGDGAGIVRLWHAPDGAAGPVITTPFFYVFHVAFSPDSGRIAVSSFSDDVAIYDVPSGSAGPVIPANNAVWSEFTSDGASLLIGSGRAEVAVWDIATGQRQRILTHHESNVTSVAFSPAGDYVASASYDATVRRLATADGAEIGSPLQNGGIVMSVAVSPDGSLIATGCGDKKARLFNAADGSLVRAWQPHSWTVAAVAFSPDGQSLATCDYSTGQIKLWNIQTGNAAWTATGHSGGTYALAFADSGTKLVSGGADRTAKVWATTNGALIRTLSSHTSLVNTVAVSPDGLTLATGSDDRTMKLWNVADGALLRTLTGHTQRVRGAAFAPAGDVVASAGGDLTVRLWDVASGAPLATYDQDMGGLDGNTSIAFSPDGRLFVYGRSDATVVAARNPFAAPPIDCADIRKFTARCRNGALTVKARLTDATHDGQSIDVDINGDSFSLAIAADRAKIKLKNRSGAKTVTLTQPAGCGLTREADCG